MKIENNNKVQLLDHLVKSANAKAPKQGAVGQKDNQQQVADQVELSGRKTEIDQLKEKVKAAPATRQDKIDAIKQSIDNGTYNVKGEDVARSILKNQVLDEALKP
ncbi:MAG TPA: flagellar biosynthesis anti-sigma factor FlgM [Syntrophorhabdales bacterium]|nr:flagellar biosynthesis anti-sigma factor FlgM [Syntrophorhabdales bacterium]